MSTRRAVKASEQKNLRQTTRVKSKRASTSSRKTEPSSSAGTRARAHTKTNLRSATTTSAIKARQVESKPAVQASPSKKEALRDDPRVDRRIIEGMLGDRESLMKEMGALGFADTAVMQRAAELGLSEALIRQIRGVAADLAGDRPGRPAPDSNLGARTCLSCDRIFLSTGPGNRLCMRCRGADAGLAIL
ncbi:MAG: hypothetical protein R3C68_04355 [Myxococcota bacterium]